MRKHGRDNDVSVDDEDINVFDPKRKKTVDYHNISQYHNGAGSPPESPLTTGSTVTIGHPVHLLSSPSPNSSIHSNRHHHQDGHGDSRGSNIQINLFPGKNNGSSDEVILETALLINLKQLSQMKPNVEDCMETARSVLLAMLRSPDDSTSKDAWEKAATGVRLLVDGFSRLTEAKKLLSS